MPPEESHPATERIQTEIFRKMSAAKKLSLMSSLSRTVLSLSYRALRRARPNASEQEITLSFIELNYGAALAARVRKYLEARAE